MKKLLIIIILLAMAIVTISRVQAQKTQQKHNQNPNTLVYAGAITKNEKEKVNIHPVSYKIRDIDIAANIYTPANYDPANEYPAVVIAHPNGGVKEQVSGLYAQRLAELGYITITADAAYQGGSGGTPEMSISPQTASRIYMPWGTLFLNMKA